MLRSSFSPGFDAATSLLRRRFGRDGLRVALTALVLIASGVGTAAAEELSVPAEFVKFIDPPGQADEFLRPSAIVVDPHFHEIFVADPGNNRILVFDRHGTYRFEFNGSSYFSTPLDIAVDSQGFLYVLGTTAQGRRVFRFDFDGLYLGEFPLPESGAGLDITSVAIDTEDRLYLLDHAAPAIHVLDVDGAPLHTIPVMPSMEPGLRSEQIIGTIEVKGDRVYVPLASLGTVHVYTREGEFVQRIGRKGTIVGELNFPVAVALTPDDLLLILDKHRFTVACFDLTGQFLGEFGGKGVSPGWFYYPTLLALDEQEQVYIGQVFRNRVQVCRIPEFVRAAHLRRQLERAEAPAAQDGLSQSTTIDSPQRRGGVDPSTKDASSIPESARNVRNETTLH